MAIRMITNYVMRMKSRTERRQIIIVGGGTGSEGAGVDDVVRIMVRMMMKRMMRLGLRMMTRKMMVVGGWRLGGR